MKQYRLGLAKWDRPSTAEMVESCIQNAEEAATLDAAARRKYDALPPGDEQLAECEYQMRVARIDQKHWRRMAQKFRAQLAEEEREATAAAARASEQRRQAAERRGVTLEPGGDDLEDWELRELGVASPTEAPEPRWDRGAPT